MATNAQDRAARRSSVTAARRAAAQIETPDALEEIMADGPSEPVSEATEPAAPRTRLQSQGAGVEAPSRTAQAPATRPAFRSGEGGAMALPMRDMSRELTAKDLVIPKLKLAQGLSSVAKLYGTTRGKEGIPAGVWYHTTTNRDLGETVYFIPVFYQKTRSMFEQGTGVVCRSFDLMHGEGNPGGLCEGTMEEINLGVAEDERGCPFRLWNRTEAGNQPPPCGETYNYTGLIVLDPEHPESSETLQAMLQMRSTHVNAAKQLNTAVVTYAGGDWAGCVIEIGVEARSNRKGDFFIPVPEFYGSTDEPGWEKIARRARAFGKQMGQADLRNSIEADPDQS